MAVVHRTVLVCRMLWSAGTAKVSAEQCRYLNLVGADCHLDYLRRGPNSRAYDDYVKGVDFEVVRTRTNPLAPLWAFLTNVAHGVPEKGAHPLEGGLDIDTLLLGTLHVARHRPEVLLCSDQFSGMVGYLVHKLRGTPYVVYLQEGIYEDPERRMSHLPPAGRGRIRGLARRLDTLVFGHASSVLGITEETLRSVRRSGYAVRGKVVFLGAPTTPEPGRAIRTSVVLSVATWDKARYPERYLEVARHLKGSRLVLAGLWRYGFKDEEAAFRRRIEREGLSDRILVTGRLTEQELADYYATAKVFLRLGIDEMGVGGGCLDALAWGVPIVTNRSLGITDILVDGVNGRVFDEVDPQAMADAINSLMGDAPAQARMSEAALATAREYTWPRHAALLLASLEEARSLGCPKCGVNAPRSIRRPLR